MKNIRLQVWIPTGAKRNELYTIIVPRNVLVQSEDYQQYAFSWVLPEHANAILIQQQLHNHVWYFAARIHDKALTNDAPLIPDSIEVLPNYCVCYKSTDATNVTKFTPVLN